MRKFENTKSNLVLHPKDIVKTLIFLYSVALLENDIHCSNVSINEKFISKLTNFWKVTLTDGPVTFGIETGSGTARCGQL